MFEQVNDLRLVEMWPVIKDIPFKQFGIRIDKAKYPVTRKDDDIYKMLMYLNLLPSPRYSFAKASNSFLVYSEVKYFNAYFKLYPYFIFKFNINSIESNCWSHDIA